MVFVIQVKLKKRLGTDLGHSIYNTTLYCSYIRAANECFVHFDWLRLHADRKELGCRATLRPLFGIDASGLEKETAAVPFILSLASKPYDLHSVRIEETLSKHCS